MAKEKSKFRIPHLLFLMLGLMIFMSIMTYLIPAGKYDTSQEGKVIFQYLGGQTPVSPWAALLTIFDGLVGSASVIAMLLTTSAAVGIILSTGAIDDMINYSIYRLEDKGSAILLPIVFFFIGILGGFGGGDQMIALMPIGVILAKKLKLDPIVALAAMFYASFIGFGTGPTRLLIPQEMMGVPVYSGFAVRFVTMILMIFIGMAYTMIYVKKIKRNPALSVMGDSKWLDEINEMGSLEKVDFNPRAALVVFLFFAQYIPIVFFMLAKKNNAYLVTIQLLVAISCGLIYKKSFDEIGNAFAKGAQDIAFVCVIIGLARSMSIIMENGNIMHTIVHFATLPLARFSKGFAAVGISVVVTFINFFIPSASGKAAILMPIIKPVSEALNLHPQIAVSAFQFGDGFTNLITPALGCTVGSCAIAKVPFNKWFKWALPSVVLMTLVSWIILYFLTLSNWTGL